MDQKEISYLLVELVIAHSRQYQILVASYLIGISMLGANTAIAKTIIKYL